MDCDFMKNITIIYLQFQKYLISQQYILSESTKNCQIFKRVDTVNNGKFKRETLVYFIDRHVLCINPVVKCRFVSMLFSSLRTRPAAEWLHIHQIMRMRMLRIPILRKPVYL